MIDKSKNIDMPKNKKRIRRYEARFKVARLRKVGATFRQASSEASQKTKNTLYSSKEFVSNRAKDLNEQSDDEVNSATNTISHTAKDISKQSYDISKSTGKNVVNKSTNAVKKANDIRKHSRNIKKTADSTQKAARESVRASRRAVRDAQKAAKVAAEAEKTTVRVSVRLAQATAKLLKALAEAFAKMMVAIEKSLTELFAALYAVGGPVLLIIVIVGMVAAILFTVYGIFFANGDSTSEYSLTSVKQTIENNFYEQIEEIKDSNEHDKVVIKGQAGAWQTTLSIYAVYVNLDPDNPDEVFTMNEEKAEKLEYIYNLVNEIDYDIDYVDADDDDKIEDKTTGEDTYVEEDDSEDDDDESEEDEKIAILTIEIEKNDIDDVVEELGFTDEQIEMVEELLSDENISNWSDLLGAPIYIQTSNENVQYIYTYLTTQMGFNGAAACGIIANIEYESGFNPNCLGDNGTSYGICQWHAGRFKALKNYCEQNGYFYTSLEGQLAYLNYELTNKYPSVYDYMLNVTDDTYGAYQAAAYWCKNFEIPADAENKAIQRGDAARGYYALLS